MEHPATGSRPNEEEIRIRAYELFLDRGGQPGHDVDDWVRAEKELTEAVRQDGAAVLSAQTRSKRAAKKSAASARAASSP